MQGERLKTLWRTIGQGVSEQLVQALYPASCAGCGLPGDWFCHECEKLIRLDPVSGCSRCGRSGRKQLGCERCSAIFPDRLTRLRAGFLLDGPLRRAVHRFKYLGEYERGRDLAKRLSRRLPFLVPTPGAVDAVVPVPLHPRRSRQRGFNQAEILADTLAQDLGVPMVEAVRRVRNTPSQTALDVVSRTDNVLGAFAPARDHTNFILGKHLVIVDDVTTTGATMAAVAAGLQQAGAASILGVALAREQ